MNYDKSSFLAGIAVGRALYRPRPTYLTFRSAAEFTLYTDAGEELDEVGWDGVLEYSTDGIVWTAWNGKTISSVNGILMLRGIGNTHITQYSDWYGTYTFRFTGTSGIYAEGNLETLLDYATVAAGGHPQMDYEAFADLFIDCTLLVKAPDLLAETLSYGCCGKMLWGCTSLTIPPRLPATTLAEGCYANMFYSCTSLAEAPELPATTLEGGCYAEMFHGCTSLTKAPELPAAVLPRNCYNAMFAGCTSLQIPPAIPATEIHTGACEYMFNACTSLTMIPALYAFDIPSSAYYDMFYQSNVDARQTQQGAYQYAYRVPYEGTGTADDYATQHMFNSAMFDPIAPVINTTFYVNVPIRT